MLGPRGGAGLVGGNCWSCQLKLVTTVGAISICQVRSSSMEGLQRALASAAGNSVRLVHFIFGTRQIFFYRYLTATFSTNWGGTAPKFPPLPKF